MKKSIFAASVCCIALAMTSCKSHESAYMAAYQQAKAQEAAQQTPTVVETPAVVQTPVAQTPVAQTQPTTTTPVASNTNVSVRTEGLSVIDGAPLRAYSVVVGSFGMKTNAERLTRELRNAGYDARVAYNSSRDLYRVVATSFDTKPEAAASRDRLEAQYPGAWLLYQQ